MHHPNSLGMFRNVRDLPEVPLTAVGPARVSAGGHELIEGGVKAADAVDIDMFVGRVLGVSPSAPHTTPGMPWAAKKRASLAPSSRSSLAWGADVCSRSK